mgnify:CR=1 FL=1
MPDADGRLLPLLGIGHWGLVIGDSMGWGAASPPRVENFPVTPIVTTPAYSYTREEVHVV